MDTLSANTLPENKVTWFHIPADDEARAWNFYAKVFGWNAQEIWKNEKFYGAIQGTIEARSKDLTHPRLIIRTETIEKTLSDIVTAGGKVIEPITEIPEIHMQYAVFEDTEGNRINLVGDIVNSVEAKDD